MRVVNRIKVSGAPRRMESKDRSKTTELMEGGDGRTTLTCSGLDSSRCGRSGCGLSSYLAEDLRESASKFSRAKRGCAKAALAVSKNRQPPTTLFNRKSVE